MSDRGLQFGSWVWQDFCVALGATTSLSSGYHPQSNGLAERTNQTLENTAGCRMPLEAPLIRVHLQRAGVIHIRGFHHSWHHLATNPLCLITRKRKWRSPRCKQTCATAEAYGDRCVPLFSTLASSPPDSPTGIGPPPRFTDLGRRCDCSRGNSAPGGVQ